MELKELMIASSGVDEHNMPKSSVVLANDFWYSNGERETVEEMTTDTPVIQFFRGDGFITLDMDFGSRLNVELDMVNDFLSAFRVVENSSDDEGKKFPVTTVVVVPMEHAGKYFIACTNPVIHCLTSNKPNGENTIIRLAFFEDSCTMYEDEEFEPFVNEDEE